VFKHIAAQFDKFDDEGSDNEGRLGMAKCLTDMLKQYMADGCPKGACWDYATKILEQVQRTDAPSEGRSQEQSSHSSHRLMHLPKKQSSQAPRLCHQSVIILSLPARGGV
jgi:hypothetical protein